MGKKGLNTGKWYFSIFKDVSPWYVPLLASIAIFILLVTFSISLKSGLDEYSDNLDNFYTHPYSVRNAVHEFGLDIYELEYIWSGHSENEYSESELKKIVAKKVAEIDSAYFVIEDNYLGPKEDLKALWGSYNEFKSYIYTVGFGINRTDHSEASHLETQLHLQNINQNLKPIESYAVAMATKFKDLGEIVENEISVKLNHLYISTGLFFFISSLIAGYLFVAKNTNIQSERKKFRESIKFAPIPLMIHRNGEVLQLSKEWTRLTGYTITEIPTIKEWSRKAYGEDSVPSAEFIMNLYQLEKPQDDGTWKVKTKNGEELIWQFHSGPLGDNTIISTAIDITEDSRKRARIEDLYNQTRKLAKAVDQSPVSIVITDLEGTMEYVNEYFTKVTGYSFEEAVGQNPSILSSGLQDKSFYKNLWETISSGSVWRGEFQNLTKDGDKYWESASISPILDDEENIINYVAVKENITHQIKSNQQLVEINEKLIDAQKIGNIGNWTFDVVSESIEWSEQLFEIYDRDIELGSPTLEEFLSYHVETEESFIRLSEALEQGKAYDELVTLITKQGQKKYIRTVGVPNYNDEEKLVQFSGVAQDITKHRNIELKLIESEHRLKNITDNLEGLVLRYVQYEDGSNDIIYISKGIEALHGVTQKQVLDDSSILWTQIAEEDIDRVVKSIQESAKNLSLWDCKWQIKTPDDSVKWVHGKGTPRKDEISGSIIWDSIITDITKEVIFEQSLKETNVRLQAAQDIARIGHWSFDVADGEVYLSPIVREIHEMDKNVSVNEGVNYYKEGYSRERIDYVVNEAIEKGIPYQEELEIITEKGNERWVRTNGLPIMKDGKCVHVTGSFMDITQEKKKEIELKNNLKEKEILLQEIHHRVKNNLAIISGLMQLQEFEADSEEVSEIVHAMTQRIQSIASVHELLYENKNFSKISFHKYVNTLCKNIAASFINQNDIAIEISIDESVLININQAVPIGLLMNELITNSFKHAFSEVDKPKIKFMMIYHDGKYQAEYFDNGPGADMANLENKSSLGTTLIFSLLDQLEADYEFDNENGFRLNFGFHPKVSGSQANAYFN